MQYNPPVITNINQVLPVIQDNPAFIVAVKEWWTTIDYVYSTRGAFDHPIARECRGLKFRNDTGELIARPYHKFHNLGECAGWQEEDFDLSQPHIFLEKLDGSMVHSIIRPDNGNMTLMTRMGLSNQAMDAMVFLLNEAPYGLQIRDLVKSHPTSTFIFEYVGPDNRIVVDYKEEALILTGIRDIFSGVYQPYMTMQAMLAGTDIPLVQPYPFHGDYASIYADEESEGSVVRWENGAMGKIKAEMYCRKHRAKELTETLKGVVQLIVDDNLDDILPSMTPEMNDALVTYQSKLRARLAEYHEGLRHILSLTKKLDQKEFALTITKQYPQATCGLLFMTRKSGDGYQELLNLIRKRYNKEADLVELFETLEFPIWQF